VGIPFEATRHRAMFFLPLQILLVSPPALIGLARYGWRTDSRRLVAIAAAVCAAVAGVEVFAGWTLGVIGFDASGAIWLPLLPFIALQMQPAGKPPGRGWNSVIYGCILLYGVYFYALAFG